MYDAQTDSAPAANMTGRQAKNAAIDNSLENLRNKISILETRLDDTINRIQGYPSPAPEGLSNKLSEKPPARPMLQVLDELPRDLSAQGDRIDKCLDMVSTITEMIL